MSFSDVTIQPARKGVIVSDPDKNIPDAAELLQNFSPSLDGDNAREGKFIYSPITGSTSPSVLHGYIRDGRVNLFASNSERLLILSERVESGSPFRVPRTEENKLKNAPSVSRADYTNAVSTTFALQDGSEAFIMVHRNGITTITPPRGTPGLDTIKIFTSIVVDVAGTNQTVDIVANPLKFVTTFNRRLIFIDDTKFYYTQEIAAIPSSPGGSAIDQASTTVFEDFDLAPLFRGGELVWCASMSKDTGSGQEAFLVFMNSTGQFAVYAVGSFAAGDIQLQGIYDIGGEPLGPYSFKEIDGDIWCATSNGIRSILQSVSSSYGYLSSPIQPQYLQVVQDDPGNWFVSRFHTAEDDYLIFSPQEYDDPISFVFNIQLKAWSTWDIAIDSSLDIGGELYITSGNGAFTLKGYKDQVLIPFENYDERDFNTDWLVGINAIVARKESRSMTFGTPFGKRFKKGQLEYISRKNVAIRARMKDLTQKGELMEAPQPIISAESPEATARQRRIPISGGAIFKRGILEVVMTYQEDESLNTSLQSSEIRITSGTRYQ